MEKLKRFLRLLFLIFLMVLASVGMSISGAAPTLPKEKETVIEDDSKMKKGKKSKSKTMQRKRAG